MMLLGEDPADAVPEREIGRHLLELYRFAEGLPLLERAVERNRRDWKAWRELGRAQANTGDEESARASLEKAVEVAEGRRDAWRDNMLLVLRRMAETLVDHEIGHRAVENRVSVNDLHATILHLLGLQHTKLTFRYNGRDFRLTDVAGKVVKDVIA